MLCNGEWMSTESKDPVGHSWNVTRLQWAETLGNDLIAGLLLPGTRLTIQKVITLTGSRQKFWPVSDRDASAGVFNETGLLQNAGCDGDAGTPCSQHVREEFLRKWNYISTDAILAHK
jgi:hypothetical protein